MNASSSANPPEPERGRLSRAVLSHPLRALALTALCAAAAAVGVNAATRASFSGTWRGTSLASWSAPGWLTGRQSGFVPGNVGQAMGRPLAGRAPQTVTLAQAETQADAPPAGAVVDRAANAIRFGGKTAAMTIVASPPNGVDMRFRVAGLQDPTIGVVRGALVKIHFVNDDSDSAHGWLLLDPVVTVGNSVHGPRAFPGAFALLGDPTSAGQPAVTIAFRASRSGTYRYECPVPGHAAMGMHGTFVVTA